MGLHVTCGWRLVVSLAVGLAAISSAAADSPKPTLDFETQRVVLRGLTPSGNVAWYSVSREPQGYSTLIAQRSGLLAADALGEAAIELEQDVAPASVWVVVDLDGGGFAVGGPPVTSFRDVGTEAWSVATGDSSELDHLVHARPYLELFWARPGVGAWVMAAGDGAAGDDDGEQDGLLQTSFAAMEPLEASPPPSDELQANDVLVVVDPRALEYYAVAFQP
jgi:hypothetical protein